MSGTVYECIGSVSKRDEMQFGPLTRRELIALSGAATALPRAAQAQQAGERRVGVLMGMVENDPEARLRIAAFRQGLREIGWTEGRNIHIELRWAADDANLARAHAAELVALAPDVIVAHSAHMVVAVQQQTGAVPIVFVQVADPVGTGLIASLAQPGGNTTGFASFEDSISAKWLELIKEVVPQASRVGIISVPGKTASSQFLLRAIETLASSMKVQLNRVEVRDLAEIEAAFDVLSRAGIEGLVVMPDPVTLIHRERTIALAAEKRIPAVYPYRYFATDGGLLSYGPSGADMWRRTAYYVDRILKGSKPAELPVQNPTKFELVVNLKTAKALGIELPLSLLMRIDEVIE
jgi:putative ABC transport system substrate-binding protein